jgi:phage terminase small subunit
MVNTYLQERKNNKQLTKKQQKFLDCLIETKGNPKEAAELAGYSTGSHYQVIKALKDEIIDLATDVLANSAPEAAFKLVDIMKTDRPIPQIGNKLQAAQTILDRVGVTKKERLEVNHTSTGGVFILPAKKEEINIIDVKSESELLQDELEPITDWESEGGR